MSPRRHRTTISIGTAVASALTLGAFLSAGSARADDVFLHNGNAFEGVIVVAESDEQVRIRLAYGEMTLPRSWIARIDRERSPLAEYLDRRRTLHSRADIGVTDWIGLARWARGRELEHGYKEALLEASRIDPRYSALSPLLRGIGYVFEESTGLWVSAVELRRAEEVREARRQAAEERARRADAGGDDGRRTTEETLSRAIEVLALAELERETRTSRREARGESTFQPVRIGGYAGPYYPYFPGFVVTPATGGGGGNGDGPSTTTPPADPYAAVRGRLPGSFLSNRGGIQSRSRPHLPGSLLSSRRR